MNTTRFLLTSALTAAAACFTLPAQNAEQSPSQLNKSTHVADWQFNNPVLPEFHADPEILFSVKTGRYYIYSTTDGFPGWGGTYFTCYSSSDLKDWKYEGVILDVSTPQVRKSATNTNISSISAPIPTPTTANRLEWQWPTLRQGRLWLPTAR